MFSDITQLNESHQLLRQLAHKLRHCRDHEVNVTYARLLDWMEQVFGTEQLLMEKHEFPPPDVTLSSTPGFCARCTRLTLPLCAEIMRSDGM